MVGHRHLRQSLAVRAQIRRPRLPRTLGETLRQVTARWLLVGLVTGASALGGQYVLGGTVSGQVLIVDGGSARGSRGQADAAYAARYDLLAQRLGCRRTGLGPDVIPGSALINLNGTVRAVTFDRGWASYEGRKPGSLAAVCLKPLTR